MLKRNICPRNLGVLNKGLQVNSLQLLTMTKVEAKITGVNGNLVLAFILGFIWSFENSIKLGGKLRF